MTSLSLPKLREFINAPVQSYSSGMQVRLGFAIATALKPDILLLDEVLAVGDAGFRAKCYSRLAQLQEKAAVILVSHSMDYIAQICRRVVHFKKGVATNYSDVNAGVEAYYKDNSEDAEGAGPGVRQCFPPVIYADLCLNSAHVSHGGSLEVSVLLETVRELREPVISFLVRNQAERPVLSWHTGQFSEQVSIPAGKSELKFRVEPLHLHGGRYSCTLSVREAKSIEHLVWYWNQAHFTVEFGKQPLNDVPFMMPYRGHSLSRIC